ncbi:TIGR03564 family F420-dependent LLM class oxidoreductase [Streptomyces sp. NPDC050085]|uniref:TIGR03564 family F420-dependent LLM class oxidoreductase n=1 Tax=Streptomyces sp. NPDC050085 TaxID=3365600 RepID=UPI0037A8A521
MTVGVTLDMTGPDHDIDDAVRRAREARASGLASLWFAQTLAHDAPTLAALVGRAVPGIHLGTSAIPVFGRHPLTVVSQAQTVQAATGGRFHLGLALGTKLVAEGAFGLPFERPVARLREFLTVVRQLVHTGQADFEGELLTARTSRSPLPVAVPGAEPPVPLLVAAMGPQALRVSGRLADGILPYLAGPRALEQHIVPELTRAAEEAGRPAPRIVAFVPGVVTPDPDALRAKLHEQMSFYAQIPSYARVIELSGHDHPIELAVLGDEKNLVDAVRRYRDAGATEVVVSGTEADGPESRLRTWEVLGELARGD